MYALRGCRLGWIRRSSPARLATPDIADGADVGSSGPCGGRWIRRTMVALWLTLLMEDMYANIVIVMKWSSWRWRGRHSDDVILIVTMYYHTDYTMIRVTARSTHRRQNHHTDDNAAIATTWSQLWQCDLHGDGDIHKVRRSYHGNMVVHIMITYIHGCDAIKMFWCANIEATFPVWTVISDCVHSARLTQNVHLVLFQC